jgi:hypothetical protein
VAPDEVVEKEDWSRREELAREASGLRKAG